MEPIILHENIYSAQDVTRLKKKYLIWLEKDIYQSQINELFEISHPDLQKSISYQKKLTAYKKEKNNPNHIIKGDWVYFPWSGNLLHTVSEKDYLRLRTNRNQYLIKKSEQKKLYKAVVGIIGLSIGSNIAINLAKQGIGKYLKLADFDIVETSNLNRINASMADIGVKKIENTAKRIWEINPYNKIFLFPSGINDKNINNFFTSPKPNIIFEIIDDFKIKIKMRLIARKKRIPVVMFSNVDNNIIIDIERFDLFPSLPLFNGLLGDLPERILKDKDANANYYAVKMVGEKLISERAMATVKDIGKKLVGRPQINSTVIISSGLSGYITKKIICEKSTINGRFIHKIDSIFIPSKR